MAKVARRTDFTLEQIRKMLEEAKERGLSFGCDGDSRFCPRLANGWPVGCILNEVGLIFLGGEEEGKEAEGDLLVMLAGKDENKRGLAHYYLTLGQDNLSDETREKLGIFEGDPKNDEIVNETDRRLMAAAFASADH